MIFNRAQLISDLIVDEGERPTLYDDANGKAIWPGTHVVGNPTTAIGHALNRTPWTDSQMRTICGWDVDDKTPALYARFPWASGLSEPRQRALANMAFNEGVAGLAGFTTFLSLLQSGNFDDAADDLEGTEWARQVGENRKNRIVSLIRTG
jgi:lysozyme